jgi:hypothetical protein
MVERITKWREESMYHAPILVHEKLLAQQLKRKNLARTHICFAIFITYYKALLSLPHIEKKVLFV